MWPHKALHKAVNAMNSKVVIERNKLIHVEEIMIM